MYDHPDHSVREIGSTRVKLRSDLIFTPQASAEGTYYLVEDPLNSRFFRLGYTEYTLISLLDGQTSLQEALARLSNLLPDHQLTEFDLAWLARWLVESDLAYTTESSQTDRLSRQADAIGRRQALARVNPLVARVPLCSPDRFFATMASQFGWLYSPLASLAWLVLVFVGAYHVFADWNRFVASSRGIFTSDNWLWLAACWAGLKGLHETSHGIVCRRYGGSVREAGLLFILFAPLAYVDVTSSWRFRSRWQRIHVAAAGMYFELLVAAAAAVVWNQTASGWLNNLCFHLVVMASLTTIVFNANPLMKFDGYYILSDLLGLPNLYVNGRQYVSYWSRRYLLGVPLTRPAWPRRVMLITQLYGAASLAWRMVITVSLIVAAAALFHGVGIVLACLAGLMWFGLPGFRFCRYLIYGKPGERPRRLRFLVTAGSLAAAVVAVFGFVPWPGACKAPAVVEHAHHTVVRAPGGGFLREIRVEDGQIVEPGRVLVVLENRELVRDVEDLRIAIRQSEIRSRQHEQRGELAAVQAEAKQRDGLRTQLDEKLAQLDRLTVRAPRAGKVIRRNLDTLAGTYLEEGDEIVSIGDEQHKVLRVSISQDDVDVFIKRIGKPVRVDLPRRPIRSGDLHMVIPRATREPIHPALAAANGGPLAVKPSADPTDGTETKTYELFAPRFAGIVPLSAAESRNLCAGQYGTVSYRPCQSSLGTHLYQALSEWIRRQLDRRNQ